MEEQIDILLATYNGENYLREQIDSILNQTYKNIRIIISDDCSKDSTPAILSEYQQKDSRIEIHLQEKNLGVVKNIEFLLKQVKNDYYMLSDQDDVWLEEKVEKSIERLKQDDADIVFGDLEVVDKDLKTIYKSFGNFMLLNRKINKYISSDRLNYLYNCVTGCTLISKKQFIDKILPIPTDSKYLIHDHWIGLIVSLNGKSSYMKETYIKYRQHGNNQIGTNKISHGFNKLEQVRELFINVKLGVFGTYVKHNEVFTKELQELNIKAYEYFVDIENKKNCNFKNWRTFHNLYKTETFKYRTLNFIIMNLPFFGKGLFKIRYLVLKLLRRR